MYSPVYHSYVLYEVGCASCKILAYFSLFPILLISHLVFSFVHLKDITILLILAGHIINEGINSLIKNYLKIPRPYHPGHDENFNIGYGLPSAHSGFMAFYTVVWGGYKSLPLSAIVVYSRYYLSYHHVDQLVIGAIVGTVMGILWNKVLLFSYTMVMLNSEKFPFTFSKDRIFKIGNFWKIKNKSK
eukprot:NODE_363_length_10100_cov_0.133787.p4 type:complete len:187 gc:universal NODE_363_length_10100_cov_0.133787:3412-2852(-)